MFEYEFMDFSAILSNQIAILLIAVMACSLIVLFIHYPILYLRPARRFRASQSNETPKKLPPVSVILIVHNDAMWLRENLPYLLEQDYPNYELVVVDFVSQDDTSDVLKICSNHYALLKTVQFRQDVNSYRGKKYPLSIGIKSAQNDIILLSEPECVPKDFNWVRRMVEGYANPETKIVLGYCGIRQKKSLFNALQVYDNLVYYLRFIAAALSGHPYTGNSCNLSYRRSFFFDHGAFYKHLSIAQGADDIFVNQNATHDNTAVILAPDSFTLTDAQPTLAKWMHKRRERTATRRFYSIRQKLQLIIYPLTVCLFYTSIVMLFINHLMPWQILAGVVALDWIWQIYMMHFATKHFGVKVLHWFAPLFEIYFIIANTILALTPLSLKKRHS